MLSSRAMTIRLGSLYVRTFVPVSVALAAVLLLAGCAGSAPKGTASSKPTASSAADSACDLKPGAASDSIKVSGADGVAPTVTFPTPVHSTKEERTVIVKGTGEKATSGRTVDIGFSAYNGTTGTAIADPFGYDPSAGPVPVIVGDASMIGGITDAIECLPVGTRVAYTAPAASAFGASNLSGNGLKDSDSVVFVADIKSIMPDRADGAPVAPTAGFPTVKLDKDGKPTVTIPKGQAAPTTTQIEVLKKGTGPAVVAGQSVTVQYQGVLWEDGKVFDQSWGKTPAQFTTDQVVKGFGDALVGQTVGSQVVAVIPPADGYGSTPPSGSPITKDSTLVFVIDILAAADAAPAQ